MFEFCCFCVYLNVPLFLFSLEAFDRNSLILHTTIIQTILHFAYIFIVSIIRVHRLVSLLNVHTFCEIFYSTRMSYEAE